MTEKKKAAAKPMVDVAPPGKSAASATSKSIIVTNHTMMPDPMMSAPPVEAQASTLTAPASSAVHKDGVAPLGAPTVQPASPTVAKKVISPITMGQPSDEAAKTPDDASPVVDEPADDTEGEPVEVAASKPNESTSDEPAEDDKSSDVPVPDAELEQTKAEEAEDAREIELQKLVDSKQFFLPINSVNKRRAERFVAAGIILSVLLALAWADVALDAGLIHLGGLKAVTHFFSN